MKKVIYFIAAALMVVSFVSCSDMLDSKSDRYVYDPALDQKVDSMFYINGILKGVQLCFFIGLNQAFLFSQLGRFFSPTGQVILRAF